MTSSTRIVVLLLVPCLLVDPASAIALQDPFVPPNRSMAGASTLIQDQAIVGHLVAAFRNIADRPAVRVCGWGIAATLGLVGAYVIHSDRALAAPQARPPTNLEISRSNDAIPMLDLDPQTGSAIMKAFGMLLQPAAQQGSRLFFAMIPWGHRVAASGKIIAGVGHGDLLVVGSPPSEELFYLYERPSGLEDYPRWLQHMGSGHLEDTREHTRHASIDERARAMRAVLAGLPVLERVHISEIHHSLQLTMGRQEGDILASVWLFNEPDLHTPAMQAYLRDITTKQPDYLRFIPGTPLQIIYGGRTQTLRMALVSPPSIIAQSVAYLTRWVEKGGVGGRGLPAPLPVSRDEGLAWAHEVPTWAMESAPRYIHEPWAREVIQAIAQRDSSEVLMYADRLMGAPWAEDELAITARRSPSSVVRYANHLIDFPRSSQIFEPAIVQRPHSFLRALLMVVPSTMRERDYYFDRVLTGIFGYSQKDTDAILKIMSQSPDPVIQVFLELYQAAKTIDAGALAAARIALLFDSVVQKELSVAEAARLTTDEAQFFQALLRIAARPNALGREQVEGSLRGFAQRTIMRVNDLHLRTPDVRFASIAPLDAKTLYTIMVFGEEEIYTSSFNGIFDRLIQKMRREGISGDQLLAQVGQLRFRAFIKMCVWFDRLNEFLATMPEGARAQLLEKFVGDLEQLPDREEQAAAVADTFSLVRDPQLIKFLQNTLRREYDRVQAIESRQGAGTILYGLLASFFQEKAGTRDAWFEDMAAQHRIPNLHVLPSEALFVNGTHVQLHHFSDDDDGRGSYTSFLAQYERDPAWRISQRDGYVVVSSVSGCRIEIFANEPAHKEKGVGNIQVELKRRGLTLTALVHRGHSYHLSETLEYLQPSVSLVFLGSCGGYHSFPEIVRKARHVHSLATRGTGTRYVNDPLLKMINERIRTKGRLEWQSVWTQAQRRLGHLREFSAYVGPHTNVSMLFLAALGQELEVLDPPAAHDDQPPPAASLGTSVSRPSPFRSNDLPMGFGSLDNLWAKLHYVLFEPGGLIYDAVSGVAGSKRKPSSLFSVLSMMVVLGSLVLGGWTAGNLTTADLIARGALLVVGLWVFMYLWDRTEGNSVTRAVLMTGGIDLLAKMFVWFAFDPSVGIKGGDMWGYYTPDQGFLFRKPIADMWEIAYGWAMLNLQRAVNPITYWGNAVVSAGLLLLDSRWKKFSKVTKLGLGMALGGAISSICDIMLTGFMTCWLELPTRDAISLAEVFIPAGAALFLVGLMWDFIKPKPQVNQGNRRMRRQTQRKSNRKPDRRSESARAA